MTNRLPSLEKAPDVAEWVDELSKQILSALHWPFAPSRAGVSLLTALAEARPEGGSFTSHLLGKVLRNELSPAECGKRIENEICSCRNYESASNTHNNKT